jgi:hypothetical protein
MSAQNQIIGPEWFEAPKSENKILFCQTFVLQICNRLVSATSNTQAGGFSETKSQSGSSANVILQAA